MLTLVLAARHDLHAPWIADQLRGRVGDVLLLTVESLVRETRWDHRLDRRGAGSTLVLGDGREIRHDEVGGVINRIAMIPQELLSRANDDDRLYALQEWTALFMSWLQSIPAPVLNRPDARGLCGAWRSPAEWAMLALSAGLPAHRVRLGSSHEMAPVMPLPAGSLPLASIIVVGAEALWIPRSRHAGVGPCSLTSTDRARRLDDAMTDGTQVESHGLHSASTPCTSFGNCRRIAATLGDRAVELARRARCELLGVELAVTPEGDVILSGVSPMPELHAGGAPLVDAIESRIAGGASRRSTPDPHPSPLTRMEVLSP